MILIDIVYEKLISEVLFEFLVITIYLPIIVLLVRLFQGEQAGPTRRFSPLDYSALANTIRHYNDFFQQLKPVHISQAVLTIISLELVCREFVHTNPTGSIRDCATL